MAITQIVDLTQTYDQSDTNDLSVAPGVHMISPVETILQNVLRKMPVTAIKNEWIEDEVVSNISALAATISDTTDTTITVTSGHGEERFADAANVNHVIKIDDEYMLVTGRSTDVLTVTRGYLSTTKTTHAADARVVIVAMPEHEGADARNAVATTRTRPSNYLQTFSAVAKVSGVQEQVAKHGGITSEMQYQLMMSFKKLAQELETALIFGKQQAGDGSSSYRLMDGLNGLIDTNRTTDSGSIDADAIEDDIKTIREAGGVPRAILTSYGLAQDIANLYADRIRTEVDTMIGGVAVTAIVNVLAQGAIVVIPHKQLNGEYFMLDTSRLVLGYLRPFFLKQLPEEGDYSRIGIYGDYTLELYNEKSCAYRNGFTDS